MRIVVFSSYFLPHKGGVEKYVHEIYKRLTQSGIVVDVITCNTNYVQAEEVIDGLKIYRIDCWNALGGNFPIPKINGNFFQIIKKINQNTYSLVNTQTRFFILSFIGFLYGKIRRIKVVHTEHGTQHSFVTTPFINSLSKFYDHTLGYVIVKYSDRVVVISKASGEFARHLGAKRYFVVYNGIDIQKFKRRTTDIKDRLGLDGYKVITFIGRLIEAKGIQDLINVIKAAKANCSIKTLIVGSGNYKKKLVELAEGDEDILFLGEKDEEEIIDILSVTDIFVNPSYSEGLPTSVLEAMACGCQTIATDVGGTKEIAEKVNQDEEIILLYMAGDIKKLEQLLNATLSNKFLVKEANARDGIGCFDWKNIAEDYLSFVNNNV